MDGEAKDDVHAAVDLLLLTPVAMCAMGRGLTRTFPFTCSLQVNRSRYPKQNRRLEITKFPSLGRRLPVTRNIFLENKAEGYSNGGSIRSIMLLSTLHDHSLMAGQRPPAQFQRLPKRLVRSIEIVERPCV
jgi:hypothetical protein